MEFPTVDKCCCCIDLITGGNIIGWLGVVSGVLNILAGFQDPRLLVQGFIVLIISICWLYGIENFRPSYMLLYLVLSFISTLLISIVTIGLAIASIYFAFFSDEPMLDVKGIPLPVFTFIQCIVSVIIAYCWINEYSIYKAVKERSEINRQGVLQV